MFLEEIKELLKEAFQGTSIVIKFYGVILLLTYLMYKFYYRII